VSNASIYIPYSKKVDSKTITNGKISNRKYRPILTEIFLKLKIIDNRKK
jgi:hypothetical protein